MMVTFKTVGPAWLREVSDLPCTVRVVDPDDERFQALRAAQVTRVRIQGPAGHSFVRRLRSYAEFRLSDLGLTVADDPLLAKICWWDPTSEKDRVESHSRGLDDE